MIKEIIACSLALSLCVLLTSSTIKKSFQPSSYHSLSTIRNISTAEVVNEMGIGINLGNTFESCGDWIDSSSVSNYEKAWGSPEITPEIIQGYADAGFGVLRVPVAWSNMMDLETFDISQDYIDRVKEVVSWAIEDNMYVIMNIHWDSGWWSGFPTVKERCMTRYTRIWEQLCENFAEFGDKLMFESLNEEGGWESLWNRYGTDDTGKADSYELLNEINQKFVDIVRSSGGNNSERHLLIAGYCTDIDLTCDELFKMPDDPAKRCAVSVHYYTPSTFCILESDASWGKARTSWGSPRDRKELEQNMDKMKSCFVDKGVPVIIGEFGAVATKNKTESQVRNYNIVVCEEACKRGLCPVLWDITDVFYDRTICQFKDADMLYGMMQAKNNESESDE
ncbi:MAG: glycoside hydrolase family 5 protein [Ruminococcus sp.]|nr:glycoside hydrolase family 5 protein [Ruminococcus sp.]